MGSEWWGNVSFIFLYSFLENVWVVILLQLDLWIHPLLMFLKIKMPSSFSFLGCVSFHPFYTIPLGSFFVYGRGVLRRTHHRPEVTVHDLNRKTGDFVIALVFSSGFIFMFYHSFCCDALDWCNWIGVENLCTGSPSSCLWEKEMQILSDRSFLCVYLSSCPVLQREFNL